ncbi:hypothetical protein SAMN06297251_12158 [Fulvimarina manganoxydans]|uniref:Uncharacterized protein n=1 Tax=Fulvimarina manganoxydans TaxID=937218 RepID=A0A1W2E690_9HYPH|nr:hypothetical protein SAMN06297251_12158 [Fulvimarina manganoxydans]
MAEVVANGGEDSVGGVTNGVGEMDCGPSSGWP